MLDCSKSQSQGLVQLTMLRSKSRHRADVWWFLIVLCTLEKHSTSKLPGILNVFHLTCRKYFIIVG